MLNPPVHLEDNGPRAIERTPAAWQPPPAPDVKGLDELQARLAQAAAVVKLRASFERWKRGI